MLRPTRLTQADMDHFLAQGLWSESSMSQTYDRFARERPNALALVDQHHRFTWQTLKEASDGLAAALVRLGLERGATVLTMIPAGALEMLLRIALKKAGLLAAHVALQWREHEVRAAARQIRAAAIIVPWSFKGDAVGAMVDRLQPELPDLRFRICLENDPPPGWVPMPELRACRATPDDVATLAGRRLRAREVSLICSSSGSTGMPKLMEWPEGAQYLVGRGTAERFALTPQDNVGIFAPLSGGPGSTVWSCTGVVPCQYTLSNSYEPDALLELIERERVTVISTIPVLLNRLVSAPNLNRYDISTLRAVRVGAAPMNREIARQAEERMGCVIIQAAGAMECITFGMVSVFDSAKVRHSFTVGKPLPGCRARIVDEAGNDLPPGEPGTLLLRSAYSSSGYINDPEATARAWDQEGWFSPGDVATQDAEGRITLVGRRKEMINRGGLKVFPTEVELAILQHDRVSEVTVVGAPHPEHGEVPWAFIVPRPGQDVSREDLVEFLQRYGLATFKIPVRCVVVSELPRMGAAIKVDKRRLLELYGPAAR